jgi:hypothetical protein
MLPCLSTTTTFVMMLKVMPEENPIIYSVVIGKKLNAEASTISREVFKTMMVSWQH